MVQVCFEQRDGTAQKVTVPAGLTLMEAAVQYGVDGIDAECGGACACATCHVYISDAWMGRLPEALQLERDMLEGTDDPQPNSRLSCQVKLTEDLDGLTVTVA